MSDRGNSPDLLAALLEQAVEYDYGASLEDVLTFYHDASQDKNTWPALEGELRRRDRFFLLIYGLGRADALHPWVYARCRNHREPAGVVGEQRVTRRAAPQTPGQ